MRFGTDESQVAVVQWQFCQPGALPLGFPTPFVSRDHDAHELWPDIGEVQFAQRVNTPTVGLSPASGQGQPCGDPAVWAAGYQGRIPPNYPRNLYGLTICCGSPMGTPEIGVLAYVPPCDGPPVVLRDQAAAIRMLRRQQPRFPLEGTRPPAYLPPAPPVPGPWIPSARWPNPRQLGLPPKKLPPAPRTPAYPPSSPPPPTPPYVAPTLTPYYPILLAKKLKDPAAPQAPRTPAYPPAPDLYELTPWASSSSLSDTISWMPLPTQNGLFLVAWVLTNSGTTVTTDPGWILISTVTDPDLANTLWTYVFPNAPSQTTSTWTYSQPGVEGAMVMVSPLEGAAVDVAAAAGGLGSPANAGTVTPRGAVELSLSMAGTANQAGLPSATNGYQYVYSAGRIGLFDKVVGPGATSTDIAWATPGNRWVASIITLSSGLLGTTQQTTGAVPGPGVATLNASFTNPVTPGNSIVVVIRAYNSTGGMTVNDNQGNGFYTLDASEVAGNQNLFVFRASNVLASGTFTLTLTIQATFVPDFVTICAQEVVGVLALDQLAGNSGTSASPTTPAVTMGAAGEYVCLAVTLESSSISITPPAGYTPECNTETYFAVADATIYPVSTLSPVWTLDASYPWRAIIVTYSVT